MLPAAGSHGQTPPADERFPQAVSVSETFDHRPFDYRIESRTEKTGYVVYRLTYPSPVVTALPQNNTIPAEYYLPAGLRPGDPKRPAVICIHILDGNMALVRMQCMVLAARGIPAILFMLPYYGERGLPAGPEAMAANPKLFVEAIAQGIEDARRTVDVLASRPEINRDRIGITGISLGGISAATVAGCEPRIHRVMPILAGGDLLTVIHHARETADLSRLLKGLPDQERAGVEAAIREVDPLRHADALRERARRGRVLMVNAAADEVIPRSCTEKLAAALGLSDRVEWLAGLGHYTSMAELPRVLRRMVDFFAQDLPAGLRVSPPAAAAKTPVGAAIGLLQAAIGLLVVEPAAGRCHVAELAVEIAASGQEPMSGRVLLVRGSSGRFKFQGRLPVLGNVALGQGANLWMASDQKTYLRGVAPRTQAAPGRTAPLDPLAFTAFDYLLQLRMGRGIVDAVALAPDVLDSWLTLTDEPAARGQRSILIALKPPYRGAARLVLADDGRTPQSVAFNVPGVSGVVKFVDWRPSAAASDGMFDPPAGLTATNVPAEQLQRTLSMMFDFAMNNLWPRR